MENDARDTNKIWEFYLKYIVKNIKELESVHFKTPQHDITKKVLNIMEFEEKVDKLNDKIGVILNSSPNDVISKDEINLFHIDYLIKHIRIASEYLKNLNRMFFLSKHVDKNGTVKIISIAKDLGYDEESEKIARLSITNFEFVYFLSNSIIKF